MNRLTTLAGGGSGSAAPDVTPHFYRPMDVGSDGRSYVSKEARRKMESQMQDGIRKSKDLSKVGLPPMALTMHEDAQKKRRGMSRVSTRHREDGFRSGDDHTYTENNGPAAQGDRKPSDTPRPRSPNPDGTRAALTPHGRSERSHQNAFRFTGLPGNTVHAPTQANQVVDSGIERFVAERPGGFMYRHDTYYTSEIYGVRRTASKQWETMSASYKRRASSPPASASSSSSSSSSASSRHRSPSSGAGDGNAASGSAPAATRGRSRVPRPLTSARSAAASGKASSASSSARSGAVSGSNRQRLDISLSPMPKRSSSSDTDRARSPSVARSRSRSLSSDDSRSRSPSPDKRTKR